MIPKKHYDVILKALIKGESVKAYDADEFVWFITNGCFAIAFPKKLQFFNLNLIDRYTQGTELIELLDASDISLKPTGDSKLDQKYKVICICLEGNSFKTWINANYIKLFPESDYDYYSSGKLKPIFCRNKLSGLIEGLVLPIRPSWEKI